MSSRNKPLDWSATAARELIDGLVHIAEDSPQGARLVKTRIDRAGRFLELNPRMGKPGVVAGTREYPAPKTRYTLIYEEGVNAIHILHCWHQSRQRVVGDA
ncbi:type II toxin-antitoxin system RelE/ParE family toxin [Sulfuritalea hydrogenivorans]|jgi:plasmid stabilization system protein ParE|uniref:RelE/StbE family addiction module toxin n=1 Tax=Sulfuritalea hydrogenivorans sk43H TaxID=1223802 RepID=W0SC00_9PROT|nr:type II toxin-antitoxin system RelE/ParE family toxin [Sulfuritalea hydrogenivorans]BAO28280.1 RelE/StbE family addiction module toxin [Sulfuritalea hydrogenivorans sk43H]